MDKSPKRKKHKDNPYEIIRNEDGNKLKFKDVIGRNHIVRPPSATKAEFPYCVFQVIGGLSYHRCCK